MTPEPGEEKRGQVVGLTKGRLENLTDGIFAFAMTLLVTTLDFPGAGTSLPPLTPSVFLSLYSPDIFHYVIAFAALAGFWVAHHIQFHYIQHVDRTAILLNIACLLFVALLPFSTAIAGDYPDTPFAAMIFEVNILVIGLFLLLNWDYATTGRRLVEQSLDEKILRVNTRMALIIPSLSVIGILLALLGATWSDWIYLAGIPFIFMARKRP